ncbi:MAG: hypothetical protein IJO62_04230 [Clostridia bacterium]|nr:hypothetical protein [Clostridia bacterium]
MKDAFIVFSKNPRAKNMSYICGDSNPEYVTSDGLEGIYIKPCTPVKKTPDSKWYILPKSETDYTMIYMDVSPEFLNKNDKGESIEIKVTYMDNGYGNFVVCYDGIDGIESHTETVDLHNTNTWLTYTFKVEKPYFDKRLDGHDLKLGLYSTYMGNSLEGVLIHSISLEKTDTYSPFDVSSVKSGNIGNIFYDGENIELSFDIYNRTDKDEMVTACYEIVNSETMRTLKATDEVLTIKAHETLSKTVDGNVSVFGSFWLKITLTNSEGVVSQKKSRFSKSFAYKGMPLNYRLGFSDHFAQGKKGDPALALELMKNGGFGINRDEILWSDTERKEGEFKVPDFCDEYLTAAEKNGIEVIFTLGKGNRAVNVLNVPARGEYEQERWRLYVRNTVKLLKGRVHLYSIYNEANIPLKREEQVHHYVECLKIAYEEIKAEDPTSLVTALTTACVPLYWIEECFKQGALKYLDVVDVHPYAWNTAPELVDFKREINDIYALIIKYGGKQRVWATEFGYPVMIKGMGIPNEKLQAENLTHAYIMSTAYNLLDKFYIYQFADSLKFVDAGNYIGRVNKTTGYVYREDPEKNFGVTYNFLPEVADVPFAAKPAYLMLSCLNRLIGTAKCIGEIFAHDRMLMYHFKCADGDDVLVYWAYWNTRVNDLTLDLGVNEVTVYDKYGNSKVIKNDDGKFVFKVTYETVYIKGKFKHIKDISPYEK